MADLNFDALDRAVKIRLDREEERRRAIRFGEMEFKGGIKRVGKFALETGRAMIPKKEDLPEIGLTTAGGLIGFKAAGIPGAVLGATLGAPAGEAIRIYRSPEERLFEAATIPKIGWAGVRGLGSETLARFAGSILGPKGVTEKITKTVKTAEKGGIEPPLSARTQGATSEAIESVIERSPFGFPIKVQKAEALDSFQKFAESVSGKISPKRTAAEIGEEVGTILGTFKDRFLTTKDNLYLKVSQNAKNSPLQSPYLQSTEFIDNILVRRGETAFKPKGFGAIRRQLENFKARVSDKKKPITIGDLINEKKNLSSSLKSKDPIVSGVESDLRSLMVALDNDIAESLERVSPEIYRQLKEADAFFAKGINQIRGDVFERLTESSPAEFARVVINPKHPEFIVSAKQILGEDGFNMIKRQWFDDIIQKSKNPTALLLDSEVGIEKAFLADPTKVLENILPYEPILNEMFANPHQMKAFEDFVNVARLMAQTKPSAAGVSMFNRMAEAVASTLLVATGISPRTAIGRKLLTTGFPKSAFAVERSIQPVVQTQFRRFGSEPEQEQ